MTATPVDILVAEPIVSASSQAIGDGRLAPHVVPSASTVPVRRPPPTRPRPRASTTASRSANRSRPNPRRTRTSRPTGATALRVRQNHSIQIQLDYSYNVSNEVLVDVLCLPVYEMVGKNVLEEKPLLLQVKQRCLDKSNMENGDALRTARAR